MHWLTRIWDKIHYTTNLIETCFISNKVAVEAHNGEWIYDKLINYIRDLNNDLMSHIIYTITDPLIKRHW